MRRASLGPLRVAGFAWAGEIDIAEVYISVDNGKHLATCEALASDRQPDPRREFECELPIAEPGSYLILGLNGHRHARPTAPVAAEWNPSG